MRALSWKSTLFALLLLLSIPPAWPQAQVVFSQQLGPTAEDRLAAPIETDLNFGAAVAVSEDAALVGMPGADFPGRVAVYQRLRAVWIRTATLLPSGSGEHGFGKSIDICGDLAVIASDRSTYVYRRRSNEWRIAARLRPPSSTHVLGDAVVCDRGLIARGVSRRLSEFETSPGVIHVYERAPNGRFLVVAKLRAVDSTDSLGESLAMDRGVLVAGATSDVGAAYVFERIQGRWAYRQTLHGSDAPVGGGFGAAVAVRNRMIVIGAPNVDREPGDETSPLAGDAYVYLPHRGTWFESQTLNPGDRFAGFLGSSIAMGHSMLALGLPVDQPGVSWSNSSAVVFDRRGAEFINGRTAFATHSSVGERVADLDVWQRRVIIGVLDSPGKYTGAVTGWVQVLELATQVGQ